MTKKWMAFLAPALALSFMAVGAEAQQHKARRLGNPATRFAKPLKSPDDLRVLLRSEKMKADVAAVLAEVGWKGSLEDLDRAAASAEIVAVKIDPGTRLPFMSSRTNRRPHALVDLVWLGQKPFDAYAFEFTSKCVRYRVAAPKPCGNFWVEELGPDKTSEQCVPPPPPMVSLGGASVCVTEPAEIPITVQNPPKDNAVKVAVDGKEVTNGTLMNGAYRFTFPATTKPGSYEVTATSGGVSSSARVQVNACIPTCSLTATTPAKRGQPFTVDMSGSRVAPGVQVGLQSAKIDVIDKKGAVVDTWQLAPGMSRTDAVIAKMGAHTLRGSVTDAAGQTSVNVCETPVEVQGGVFSLPTIPVFLGGYFGKERLTHDEAGDHDGGASFTAFSRCSPLAGFQVGLQPKLGEKAEFEAALGLKLPFDDDAHTTLFADAAVNGLVGRGFLGGGVSYWDIGKDSGGAGLLLQGGVDLDQNGRWQFLGQTRVPFFNQMDHIDNNYQFWGGIRFRPNASK